MPVCVCFITSIFVYVYMGFIFECIYLGIVFMNEHVWVFIFCFDYIVSHVHKEKEKKYQKKKKEVEQGHFICKWLNLSNICFG